VRCEFRGLQSIYFGVNYWIRPYAGSGRPYYPIHGRRLYNATALPVLAFFSSSWRLSSGFGGPLVIFYGIGAWRTLPRPPRSTSWTSSRPPSPVWPTSGPAYPSCHPRPPFQRPSARPSCLLPCTERGPSAGSKTRRGGARTDLSISVSAPQCVYMCTQLVFVVTPLVSSASLSTRSVGRVYDRFCSLTRSVAVLARPGLLPAFVCGLAFGP